MQITIVGQLVIALGMSGLGVLGRVHDDFALAWQSAPARVARRETLAMHQQRRYLCVDLDC